MTAARPHRRTKTAREVAEKLGISPRTVRKYAAEPRADYLARAKERRARIIALQDQGLTYSEIAEHTGETHDQVVRLIVAARANGEIPVVDGRTRHARAHRAALRVAAAEPAQKKTDPTPDTPQ